MQGIEAKLGYEKLDWLLADAGKSVSQSKELSAIIGQQGGGDRGGVLTSVVVLGGPMKPGGERLHAYSSAASQKTFSFVKLSKWEFWHQLLFWGDQ